ncbi:ABC transporter ATP-binding protein [Actinoplanes sp. NPDC026619]|uniref:ABC transporter ATP-binding protein n=1 Tax=Actinoplanes sp. NPDC026619 TaxID=3155798 RepID=UPI0033F71DB0
MPVLTARGAGVRQHRRWLFHDLDVSVEPGEVVAVVGPPGSGRTTLLLALVKRFRLAAGQVTVDGRAALGYVPDVTEPESVFTVTEHVHERLALFGRRHREAAGVDLRGLDPNARGRDLSPYEKQVLGLVLALLERPAVIALDGLDDSLDAAEQTALLTQLTEIAATGTAVLFIARDADPSQVTTVIRLGADDHVPDSGPSAETRAEPEVTETEGEVEAERVGFIEGTAERYGDSGDDRIPAGGSADAVSKKAAAEDQPAGGETKKAEGEADADGTADAEEER